MKQIYLILSVAILILSFVLRFFHVDTRPHDLYIDEVSIGYSAYSIVSWGHDEYGVQFPSFFRSLNEYKLPGYIYLVSFFQSFLGETSLALRLPSVISGVISVWFLILLLHEVGVKKRFSLFGGFLLAVSPWHLQFSRGGFEANTALTFILVGTYFIVKGLRINSNQFFLGLLFYILSLYTYHSSRLFVPILSLLIMALFWNQLKKTLLNKRGLLLSLTLLVCLIPFFRFAFSSDGLIRLRTESFLREVKSDLYNYFTVFPYLTLEQYLKNYTRSFSLDFLFFSGDQIGRHSVREIGQNFVWLLPFFLIGVYRSIKQRQKSDLLFIGWYTSVPFSAAFVLPNPHALRTLGLVVPFSYFCVRGLQVMVEKHKNIFMYGSIVLICIYFFISYLHIYYVHYPKRTSADWSGGYKEVMDEITSNGEKYNHIFLTKDIIKGYIYLYYYGRFNPRDLAPIDNHYQGFGKYEFISSPFTQNPPKGSLYVSPFWEDWKQGKLVKKIYDKSNTWVFTLWEY